jgi:hypothetical protein
MVSRLLHRCAKSNTTMQHPTLPTLTPKETPASNRIQVLQHPPSVLRPCKDTTQNLSRQDHAHQHHAFPPQERFPTHRRSQTQTMSLQDSGLALPPSAKAPGFLIPPSTPTPPRALIRHENAAVSSPLDSLCRGGRCRCVGHIAGTGRSLRWGLEKGRCTPVELYRLKSYLGNDWNAISYLPPS